MTDAPSSSSPTEDIPSRASPLLLGGLILLALYLSCLVLKPFTAVLTCALALTIALQGIFDFIKRVTHRKALAASLALLLGIVIIIGPFIWVSRIIFEAYVANTGDSAPRLPNSNAIPPRSDFGFLSSILEWLEETFGVDLFIQRVVEGFTSHLSHMVAASIFGMIGLFLVFFTTFFFLRDGEQLVDKLKTLIPLSNEDTNRILKRVVDTIHATLFGIILVSLVQGALGGLIFWWLTLPQPILWGVVMAVLAMAPYLGAFIIWIPVAVSLALQGRWGDAVLLVVWGAIVIGLSDNLLYPILVGKRLHYHTVLVFFFLLGGLLVFGSAGIILGPIVLALTDGLLETWRGRQE